MCSAASRFCVGSSPRVLFSILSSFSLLFTSFIFNITRNCSQLCCRSQISAQRFTDIVHSQHYTWIFMLLIVQLITLPEPLSLCHYFHYRFCCLNIVCWLPDRERTLGSRGSAGPAADAISAAESKYLLQLKAVVRLNS
ncbi:hypothetical protein GQ42DRAFT_29310 [Ramicandelaber brevisporus]|nr:hypothetical protein GQ42DRAFT_52586 [Ramicandelaber brevisporus]KAI8869383.1 hypothetical protein GQ42DRAFT_29310 [Ramicandelaber brevisporus]